jgi:2,4-dienoyl-CoA reductase-like NADH-dependent reductase (Old Yellow Enzyme family)
MAFLFEPLRLKDVVLRNRIGVPPMCQYMAQEGLANDWHHSHYAALARGGAALVTVEAAAVSPEGRITPACLGLWNDAQAEPLAAIAQSIRRAGAVPGIQIGHAGRKASAHRPWEGDDHIPEGDATGWQPISSSAIAFGGHLYRTPRAMTSADIQRVQQDFVDAAVRARDAGFEWLELHFAHGYLGQSFFSNHANARKDAYGGSFENRSRFLLDTLRAVRRVWPERLPLTARFGVIEYDGEDEHTLAESIMLARQFKVEGLDLLSVSVGFSTPNSQVPWGPGFLGSVAGRVRTEVGIPVSSAWGFEDPAVAEVAVAQGQLDLALVGRAHLANPHWPYAAAQALKQDRASWVLPVPYADWLERYQPTYQA